MITYNGLASIESRETDVTPGCGSVGLKGHIISPLDAKWGIGYQQVFSIPVRPL